MSSNLPRRALRLNLDRLLRLLRTRHVAHIPAKAAGKLTPITRTLAEARRDPAAPND